MSNPAIDKSTALPVIGVAPSPFVKGVSSLADIPEVAALETVTLEDALGRQWNTDAHMVSYCLRGMEPGDPFARCNKPIVREIEEQGHEIVRTVFVLDWDTPDHEPWGKTISQVEFQDMFIKAIDEFPLLGLYASVYYTRQGARIIYILDDPMEVRESEGALRWFTREASKVGLKCDMLTDWTRLYRLPRVVRDGEKTPEESYFDIDYELGNRLPVSELGKETSPGISKQDEYISEVRELDLEMPDIEAAKLLVEYKSKSSGRFVLTEWAKAAKKRLKGRECFSVLFEHKQLASAGERDNTIHQYVGQAVSMTFGIRDTTPEHIFGLFIEPVMALEPDDEKSWVEVLWSAICRLYAKEEAKGKWQEEQEAEQERKQLSVAGQVLEGMREWCDAEPLLDEDPDAFEWVRSHLIASSGSVYYIIGRDGYFRNQEYRQNHLPAAIRKHLPELIDTTEIDNGKEKDIPAQNILSKHLTVVKRVEALPGLPNPYIENIDEPSAVLKIPAYRRNPYLVPDFDEEVDEWLQVLFGGNKNDAERWIAFALDFEGGATCALSIKGGQGVGKKLLTQGLAECLEQPMTATDNDLTSGYQYGLLESPFLVVNEGWSGNSIGGKHPADKFREVTSGDPILVNRRYRDPVIVRNPVRVIFTANNLDVIRKLADKDNLSKDDREALAVRLLHFDVGDEAARWLKEKGGMKFTSAPGNRWISTDHGEPGDFVVAKHFLWLYEHRYEFWDKGQRFLVEGSGSDELMFEMETQVGVAPMVIEVLLGMLERHKAINEIVIDEKSQVYVVPSGILNHWRNHFVQKTRGQPLNINNILHTLTGICKPAGNAVWSIPGHERKGERMWREVDLKKVIRAAEDSGVRTDELKKLLAEQRRIERDGKRSIV